MATEPASIVLSAADRTAAAFASATRNLRTLQKNADALSGSLRSGFGQVVGVAGLLGTALSTISFRRLVDGLDALNDLKDATGSSIENLSALEDIGARTGTTFDGVASTLTKFNRVLKDAKPDSDVSAILDSIGLSAERLKSLDPAEALRETAVALNTFEDDGKKARIVAALFGKTIEEVAPFLKDLAEAGKLNATVTTAQAKAAEDLNKQIFALEKNIKDVARGIASDLVPNVGDLIAQLVDGRKAFGNFTDAILTLGTLNPNLTLAQQIDDTRASIERLNGELADVTRREAEYVAAGARPGQFQPQIEQLQKRLDLLARTDKFLKAQQARGALKLGEGVEDDPRIAIRRPSAPDIADPAAARKAAAEALANLRKVLDGNLKLIAGTLAATQDELRHHEQVSQALLEQGTQSLERFYADQDKARQDNLAAIRQATDAEIAERERLLNSPLLKGPDKAAERQDVRNQIAAARATLAAAERDAAQQQELDTIARRRAVEALRDEVSALDAQIRDLASGSNVESDLLQIANRVRDAGRAFVREGATEAEAAQRAAELGRLLELQREFNQTRENFARVTNEAAAAEELLLIAARRGGAGLLETEDKVREARTAALEQIEALVEKTRELLALNPGNSQLQEGLRELEVQAARAREQVDPRKLRFDAAADDIGDTIADGFTRAAIEGENLRDVIRNLDKEIASIVLRELFTKPIALDISNFIKGAGGQGTGQNLIGQLAGLNAPKQTAPQASDDGTTQAINETIAGIRSLGGAATGSADVLGQLPQLAAIPATTALGALAGAAQIAAANLLQVGGAKAGGDAGSAIAGLFGSGGGTPTTGDFARMDRASGGGTGGGTNWISLLAGLFGFDKGGYTGNAPEGQATGVVHGKEFVLSAPAVRAIGVPALEALHEAARSGKTPLLPGMPGAAGQGGAGGAAGEGGIGGAAGAPGAAGGAAAPAHVAIQNLQQIGGPTEAAVLGVPGAPGRPGEGGAAGAPAIAVQNLRMAVARAAPGSAGLPGEPGAPATAMAVARTINAAAQAAEAVTPGPESPPGTRPVAAAPTSAQVALQNIRLTGAPGLPAAASPGAPGGPGGDGAAVQIAVGNLLQMARAPVPREWREAQRMHTGGIVGELPDLRPGEVPIIGERGEELVPRRDPRHRDNGGGRTTVQNLTLNVQERGRGRATALQEGEALFRAAQLAAARNG